MKKIKDCRGEIRQAIQAAGWSAENIAEFIKEISEANNIPASVSVYEASTGGLFGKTMPCVMVSHPNPPQQYFSHLIIINGDIINFQYWGMSKANYNNNMKEMDRNSGKISGLIKSALRSDMRMELQTEQLWHQQILSIYEAIWFPQEA